MMLYRLFAFLTVALVAASAHAFVVPLNAVDAAHFSGESEEVTLVAAQIDAERSLEAEAATGDIVWRVEAELVFRNATASDVTHEVAVVDELARTATTELWVDGVRLDTEPTEVRYDAFSAEIPPYHAQRAALTFTSGALVRVRAVTYVSPEVDAIGQVFLRMPTGLLSFWEGEISQAFIRLDLFDRPIGLQASMSGYTFYDEPTNVMSWYARDWEPTQPLQVAYLPLWSMLTLIADREACPVPTDVVMHMSSGDDVAINGYLGGYDPATLRFCAALPLALHGYPFPADEARAQFSAIPVSRYVPTDSDRGSIYVENPTFTPDALVGFEAIYRRTLEAAAQ